MLSLASWAAQRVWESALAATDCSAEEMMGVSACRLCSGGGIVSAL